MKSLLTYLLFISSIISYSQSWQDVGGGTNNSSHGMLVWDGKLINLGSFNNPCNRVAAWDGTSWSCLDGGVGIVARAGCVWNGKLVVVGDFWNNFQPCQGCNGVAVWDGTAWSALDQGFNNDVLTCTVHNGELYIGGDFTQADGIPINRVAKWDTITNTFVSVGNPTALDNDVRCMTSYDGQLWVGGDFNNVDGCSPCDGLVKWDETNQVWEGGNAGVDLVGGVNETVRVLFVNPSDGNLYMGGHFPELIDGDAGVTDYNMSGVAMYDGSNWFPLGTGLNEYCRAIYHYNGDVIVGGYFTDAGGVAANKIAKWDPVSQSWSAMGQGFDGVGVDEYVKSAMTWNGIFFAGGAYTQAEGNPMNYIAQWYEAPTNPPIANISSSTNAVCEGQCINYADGSTNSPTSWSWTFNGADTPTSTAQNPGNICYSTAGTYTVQLQACNANGCDMYTMTVQINDVPSVSVNNETICTGQSATITASPSVSGGNYLWSPGGETTSSITVSPGTTTSYSVDYSLNGCQSTTQTATVTVNPTPTVTVNDVEICEGDNVTLTATPSSSGGSYSWTPTGETTSSISVSPTSTTSYDVTYSLNGCSSAVTTSIVTVNPIYTVSENVQLCEGDSYTYPDGFTSTNLTANDSHTSLLQTTKSCDSVIVTNVSVIPTYSNTENVTICGGTDYTYPDGTISTNISTDESHVSNLTSSEGCDSTITTSLTVIPSNNTAVTQSATTLTADLSGAAYQWLDCDNNYAVISGETGQSFTAVTNGNYAVQITNSGCTDTSACYSISSVDINENSELNNVSIFPNPTSSAISLISEDVIINKIEIYDVSGKIIHQVSQVNNTSFTFHLSGEKGIYILKLYTDQSTMIHRVIKQ